MKFNGLLKRRQVRRKSCHCEECGPVPRKLNIANILAVNKTQHSPPPPRDKQSIFKSPAMDHVRKKIKLTAKLLGWQQSARSQTDLLDIKRNHSEVEQVPSFQPQSTHNFDDVEPEGDKTKKVIPQELSQKAKYYIPPQSVRGKLENLNLGKKHGIITELTDPTHSMSQRIKPRNGVDALLSRYKNEYSRVLIEERAVTSRHNRVKPIQLELSKPSSKEPSLRRIPTSTGTRTSANSTALTSFPRLDRTPKLAGTLRLSKPGPQSPYIEYWNL